MHPVEPWQDVPSRLDPEPTKPLRPTLMAQAWTAAFATVLLLTGTRADARNGRR